jgi:hypothetical protein
MDNFFVFKNPDVARHDDAHTDAMQTDSARHGEAPTCHTCGKYIGLLPLLPPVRVELELYGRYFGDVAFVAHQILISTRLLDAYNSSNLTGLCDFFPVEITKVRSRKRRLLNERPQYVLASVSRSRAAIDTEASAFEWESGPKCAECRRGHLIKRWSRIIIEPGTWSGEDLFYPRGLSVILVTGKFREMYVQNDFRNGVFIPSEEYGHDFYPWEKGSALN